jgi:uncharacterized membrane protein YphA (DoxX/SURF4 family)
MNGQLQTIHLRWKLYSAIVVDVIAWALVFLFVYAAGSKLLDYEKFTVQLSQSPMLTPFANWIGLVVVGAELLIAVLLITPRLRMLAFYASFSLMVMFTTYIIAILNFSSYIPCSCGGVLEKLNWTQHLIFNILFVALSMLGVLLEYKCASAQSDNHIIK